MTKRSIEILRNLEILCFINEENISKYFVFLKEKISEDENEKKLMNNMKAYWLKRYKNLFNYAFNKRYIKIEEFAY